MSDIPTPLVFVSAPPAPATFNVLHPTLAEPDLRRFFDKVEMRGEDECWPWKAGVFAKSGYPMFWLKGESVGGHRVMCALYHGLARGRYALHSCDNPGCVNPKHLRWGTPAENMADRSDRGRAPVGDAHPNSKLRSADVARIRERFERGATRRHLAEQYGVTYQAIDAIVKNVNWSAS